jgi:predicted AlkP superfamily pyrophosphatase or phosphodiesterase
MKKFIWLLAILISVAAARASKPKLVLTIMVDQFRYDYLTRFRSQYTAGLDRLLTRGAVFTNARYEHFPTVTAIGHSTILSGATPSISGIVGNDWYDRDLGRTVTSVFDDTTQPLGGRQGASPRRMLVSTLGDELKIASKGKSRVIGVSIKDRSAILPAGHMADGAFWFDDATGSFVSSTYYFPDLPSWVKDFNAGHQLDRYRGQTWLTHKLPEQAGRPLYAAAEGPFGNDLVEGFVERAVQAEQLGKHDGTDLLAISFSSNDHIGHEFGPDSPEVEDISVRTDRIMGQLFQFLETQVGMDNVLVVLSADHGVSPVPEVNTERKMPGGRMPDGLIKDTVQKALTTAYGEGNWITSPSEHSIYLNWDLIRQKNLKLSAVAETAKEAVLVLPHVFRVYTRDQLVNGNIPQDQIGRRVSNGYYVRRGADILVLLEPYWMFSHTAKGTTHGTTFSYDAHVPVIFMGPGIKAGRYYQAIAVNDVAPTLATMLDVEIPSGSVGRVLSEIFTD